MQAIPIEFPTDWTEYELIDSGNGEKLERFGHPENGYTIVRPDPRILWASSRPELWPDADAIYKRSGSDTGSWVIRKPPPDPWRIHFKNLTFSLKPTEFKHTGIFPEQAVNWNWLTEHIGGRPLYVLNLFAYTGGATMAAAWAGAHVTQVDSVKSALSWANENCRMSNIDKSRVRFLEDDAYKFVLREAHRVISYNGIIMDPPRFGRGPKGEVWKFADHLPKLLKAAASLLSKNASFLLLNAYTADFSALALKNLVENILKDMHGIISFGELALIETVGKRLVPQGIFVRWKKSEAFPV